MQARDFEQVKYFTQQEIESTGANIDDVQYVLIEKLSELREAIDRPIKLQKNGITSGKHSAIEHKAGLAIDFYIADLNDYDVVKVILIASEIGFKGIGVYWNGRMWSFHLDLRPELKTWLGTKNEPGYAWEYKQLKFHK